MSTAAVTVCVSTRNRSAMLEELFEALAAQDADFTFDVAVTDDGSTDDTPAMLEKLRDRMPFEITVHRNEQSGGPAAGRNLAASTTDAPLLAFTDDDCRPEASWLRRGVSAMQGHRAVVVGSVLPTAGGPSGHPLGRVVASYHWNTFITSNVFYRTDDFRAAGGFDTGFPTPGGEDTDLGLRICKNGAEPRYEPSAVVRHPVRERNLKIALREATRWHGIPLLIKKHPEQREYMLRHGFVWRKSHQWMLVALLSLALTPVARVAIVGVTPWVWYRVLRTGSRWRRKHNLASAPALALIDILEIAACIRGSVRDRTLTL